MLKKLRKNIARKIPSLYNLLLPMWIWYVDKLWKIRNIALRSRPIEVKAGSGTISMLAEGHIAEVIWKHEFERNERIILQKYLREGMCVLNIGANAGLYTLMAAKIVGSKGAVHAFEPATVNFDRLKRNVKLNGLTNVIINQMAVSDFTGSLAVLPDPAHPELDSHYFVQRVVDGKCPEGTIELINCDTLDNYWMRMCRGSPTGVDMIIIDVEGEELNVFKGADAIFDLSPNLIMLAECTNKLDEIQTLLRKNGFKFFKWDDNITIEETSLKRGNIIVSRQSIKFQ